MPKKLSLFGFLCQAKCCGEALFTEPSVCLFIFFVCQQDNTKTTKLNKGT